MRTFFIIIALTTALCACSNSDRQDQAASDLQTRIDSLENLFFDKEGEHATTTTGMELVRAYAHVYKDAPDDSLSVEALFKAGEVSMGIAQGNLAVKYFKMLYDEHPDFHKAPEALFLCGFCEENLNSHTSDAKWYYEKFLEEYPDHHLAEDARFSLENLGLSDEELIRRFQKQDSDQQP